MVENPSRFNFETLFGPNPQMRLTRWLFLRGISLIYLIAFMSFGVQARGLIGSTGILPLAEYHAAALGALGKEAYRVLPSIFWFSTSDAMIVGVCIAGTVLAVLLLIGFAQRWLLIVLYLLYLSLVYAGQVFMSFQWDILLLEAGFLAIFLAPPNLLPRPTSEEQPPLMAVIWLFRLLLFRLMFASGAVKLLSHDPTWHNLTAMSYHYVTQPIPNPIAWYAYQFPLWMDKASTLMTFVVELGVPFLYFAPRRFRFVGAALTVILQLFITLTGNFGFFNWLTIVLCIPLLDDRLLYYAVPARWSWLRGGLPVHLPSPIWRGIVYSISVLILMLGVTTLLLQIDKIKRPPLPVAELMYATGPLRIVNGYGLFSVMTTRRPEIIIEGSNDGETWKEYEFRYKAGSPGEAPPFVAPHMPRLDWQMWFAALSPASWFDNLMFRLQEGSPEVLALLEHNPFPDGPPRYLRARLYNYTFTDFDTRRESGDWWQRSGDQIFFPTIARSEP
jgi:lipase maturation factor 1